MLLVAEKAVLTIAWPLQKYGKQYEVVDLDKDAKVATLASGARLQYDALLSTMPLDLTLCKLGRAKWASELLYRPALKRKPRDQSLMRV